MDALQLMHDADRKVTPMSSSIARNPPTTETVFSVRLVPIEFDSKPVPPAMGGAWKYIGFVALRGGRRNLRGVHLGCGDGDWRLHNIVMRYIASAR